MMETRASSGRSDITDPEAANSMALCYRSCRSWLRGIRDPEACAPGYSILSLRLLNTQCETNFEFKLLLSKCYP